MIDHDKFFAWLDGELSQAEAAEIERQVAVDPELARLASEHRAMAGALRGAFDEVSAQPVPPRLAGAVGSRSNVVSMSGWKARLSKPLTRPVAQVAAMAASLALGLFVGTSFSDGSGLPAVEVRSDRLYAAGAIQQGLEKQLASAPVPGDVRIGLTFRDEAGAICRTFEAQAAAGLACRDQDQWRIRALFEGGQESSSEFRMAAGADPRLMELVDSTMAGEAFDADQEAKAQKTGWR